MRTRSRYWISIPCDSKTHECGLGELRPFGTRLSLAVPLALRSNSAAGEFGQDVAEVIERQHLVKIAGQ
ncbi:MAG TPA: hypothetical protein VEI99_05185 [Terriglobales bacterium]|nr:hypothetical protein [Terriglobales bacterium]